MYLIASEMQRRLSVFIGFVQSSHIAASNYLFHLKQDRAVK